MFGSQSGRAMMAACVFLLAAPAVALGATQGASSGIVSSQLTYQGVTGDATGMVLTIKRSGQVVYRRPVTSPACSAGREIAPQCSPNSRHSVHVVDLQPGGEPNVVLDLFSAGNSVGDVEQVFSYDPATKTYVRSEHEFDAIQASLEDLGHTGRDEFVSSDGSFTCKFAVCPYSGTPIEILAFGDRRFTDVTASYPSLLARDAAKWLRRYKTHLSDGLGWIAAWAADEDLVGHSAQVQDYLTQQLKAGHLVSREGYPTGRRLIANLNKFLRKHGYLH